MAPLHDTMKPLAWLLGHWKASNGLCQYPTFSKTLVYSEDLRLEHTGQAYISYNSFSIDQNSQSPLHGEMGFLRMNPNQPNHAALVLSHMHGMTEVSEGNINSEEPNSLVLTSTTMSCTSFGPAVQKIVRKLKLIDEQTLEQIIYMETVCTPLTEHCRSLYKKQS